MPTRGALSVHGEVDSFHKLFGECRSIAGILKHVKQCGVIDRLDEMMVEAGLVRAPAIFGLSVAGNGDDRRLFESVLPQRLGHFVTAHSRQADIQEDGLRSNECADFQRGGAVVGSLHLVAVSPSSMAAVAAVSWLSSTTKIRSGWGSGRTWLRRRRRRR